MVAFLIAKTYIYTWIVSRDLNVYSAKEGKQGKPLYKTIIFSYEKFKVHSSGNINHVKVASRQVLSANLAYANTGEQSGQVEFASPRLVKKFGCPTTNTN